MVNPDIKVEGFESLERKWKGLETAVKRRSLRAIFRRAGRPVITKAKQNLSSNRRTGELVKNIAQTVKAEQFATGVEVEIGMRKKQFYGGFLELGTAFIAPSPWLLPALVHSREKILAIISVGFMKEILKIAKKG